MKAGAPLGQHVISPQSASGSGSVCTARAEAESSELVLSLAKVTTRALKHLYSYCSDWSARQAADCTLGLAAAAAQTGLVRGEALGRR